MRTGSSTASITCSLPSSPSSSSSPTSSPSSNHNSATTTASFALATPPPSSYSSNIPFSWERKPGVPKPAADDTSTSPTTLPLPPPRKKRPDHFAAGASADDPFATALLQCSKLGGPTDKPASERIPIRRTARDRFGLMLRHTIAWDPLRSCRSNRAVAEPTPYVRRPGQQMIAYDLLNRPR